MVAASWSELCGRPCSVDPVILGQGRRSLRPAPRAETWCKTAATKAALLLQVLLDRFQRGMFGAAVAAVVAGLRADARGLKGTRRSAQVLTHGLRTGLSS